MRDVYALTRELVDIPSVSGDEFAIGTWLFNHLSTLAVLHGGRVERMDVEAGRFNVLAAWGSPLVTLSTHMDTVPPFFPSREDEESIWGRGACDAKGILAAMLAATEKLLGEGVRDFGLLLLVGEERGSTGAKTAAGFAPPTARYLVAGEPTENRLALGSKGVLRLEITCTGRAAHSAYPELGESAIEKLLDVLESVRRIPLPEDAVLGATTVNIGTIAGGVAPNVVAASAHAEVLVRLVGEAAPVREAFEAAVGDRAKLKKVLSIPAMSFERLEGLPTTVVSYATDAPVLGPGWGKPLLIGPGSIRVAHTAEERIAKAELDAAVVLYAQIVRRLLCQAGQEIPEARAAQGVERG